MRSIFLGLAGAALIASGAAAGPVPDGFPASCGAATNLALTSEVNKAVGFSGPLSRPSLANKPFRVIGYFYQGRDVLYEVAHGRRRFFVIGHGLARGSAGTPFYSYSAEAPGIRREVRALRRGHNAGANPYHGTGFVENVAAGPLSGLNLVATNCRS